MLLVCLRISPYQVFDRMNPAPEPVVTENFINFTHQPVCLDMYLSYLVKQRLGKHLINENE